MIPDFTKAQLAELELDKTAPLIICDVDDVVVHFLRGFDAELAKRDHVLEASSFNLNGNVLHRQTRQTMPTQEVSQIVDDYFIHQTEFMEAIDGAVATLLALANHASVVMLTNLPHHAREKRIANLKSHGLHFPVITNHGPKGPAISELASRTNHPCIFIDDSPAFIRSAREHAPDVHLVHFLHDERFWSIHKPFEFVGLTTQSWPTIHTHVLGLLGQNKA